MTIGFIGLLLERALFELFEAVGADKMLRVELAKHRRNAATCN